LRSTAGEFDQLGTAGRRHVVQVEECLEGAGLRLGLSLLEPPEGALVDTDPFLNLLPGQLRVCGRWSWARSLSRF
jgi:hypothetical protein